MDFAINSCAVLRGGKTARLSDKDNIQQGGK